MDNRDAWRRIESTTKVANDFNQDSAAETKAIKIMMKEVDLDMMMKKEQGCREVIKTLQQNPRLMLIKICVEEAKKY